MPVSPVSVHTGRLEAADLTLDPKEAARRLGVPLPYRDSVLDACSEAVAASLRMKYCYLQAALTADPDGTDCTDLGFVRFTSHNLATCLRHCRGVYVFAATLGAETDRLLQRLAVTSPAEGFIADAVASAYAEAMADAVSTRLASLHPACVLTPRFSPGYGDLDLTCQRTVLDLLEAHKRIGIALGASLLMTPSKSVTALQGVKNV